MIANNPLRYVNSLGRYYNILIIPQFYTNRYFQNV